MNYITVTAAHRINAYLRSGELQSIAATLYNVLCISIGYTAAALYVATIWAIDTLLTPHFDDSWTPQEWELSPVYTCSEPPIAPTKIRRKHISPSTVAIVASFLTELPARS